MLTEESVDTPKRSSILPTLAVVSGISASLIALLLVVFPAATRGWPAKDIWLVAAGLLLAVLAIMHRQAILAARRAVRDGQAMMDLDEVARKQDIARLKTTFVSNVSHEFRTPLSAIKASIEMLNDGEAEEPEMRDQLYGIISVETGRLERMVDNVMDISRIETGLLTYAPEEIDINPIVTEAIQIAMPVAEAKGVALRAHSSTRGCEVHGDRAMILRVVLNLLSNAIKYTDRGGQATVSVWPDRREGTVVCEVRDTGIGLAEEDLARIFEKFYRVEDPRSPVDGAGLGLALVQGMIETVHEGALRVTSQPGQGSCFGFELPAARLPSSQAGQENDCVAKEDSCR
jgi:two-component system, OmpR family, phosphate regulon sensor histidine kinase PhoR